jgi:hypothetical protein
VQKKLNSLPSARMLALGKEILCRVSDTWHSAKKFKKNKMLKILCRVPSRGQTAK